MTEISTVDRKSAKKPARKPHDDAGRVLVSGYKLAAHLGMVRQNVDALTSHGVLTRRSDGRFDQDASRLAYIKHLREQHRHTPRSEAAAEHAKAKTALLQIRIEEQQRTLVRRDLHEAKIDNMAGFVLTKLGGWPARVAGQDLVVRRRAEAVLRELRTKIAEAATKLADECGEPSADADA
jgi:hypothetical protein